MAENEITASKILSIAGLILFAMIGWMFNKIIHNMDSMELALEQTIVTQAVLAEKVQNLKDGCRRD